MTSRSSNVSLFDFPSKKLVLSDRDRDLLIAKLENPPVLNGNLKLAIKEYQDKYQQQ